MLTVDDLAGLALFAGVPAAELDRLARAAADVHLAEGEFLVHEGDAVRCSWCVDGRIELTKLFGGEERVIGAPAARHRSTARYRSSSAPRSRRPPAPPSRRACCASTRRSTTRWPAASPKFAQTIGALALERLGGLQGIAAEPPKPQAIDARRPLGPGAPRSSGDSCRATRSPSTGYRSTTRSSRPKWGAVPIRPSCPRCASPTAPRSSARAARSSPALLGLQHHARAPTGTTP